MRIADLDDAAIGALMACSIAQQGEGAEWDEDEDWAHTGYVCTNELGPPLKPHYVTRLFDQLRSGPGCRSPHWTAPATSTPPR